MNSLVVGEPHDMRVGYLSISLFHFPSPYDNLMKRFDDNSMIKLTSFYVYKIILYICSDFL